MTVNRSTLTRRPRASDPSGRDSTTNVLCASPCGRTLMGTVACSENSSCVSKIGALGHGVRCHSGMDVRQVVALVELEQRHMISLQSSRLKVTAVAHRHGTPTDVQGLLPHHWADSTTRQRPRVMGADFLGRRNRAARRNQALPGLCLRTAWPITRERISFSASRTS